MNNSTKIVAAFILLSQAAAPSPAVGPVNETALRNAWALCTQRKYVASADAFEALIRTSTPNARLYYYAAAANRSCNRLARAKQLSDYVIANFPQSAEAVQAKQLFPQAAATTIADSGVPAGLTEALKNKSLEELMQTEEGRKALKDALKKPAGSATASYGIPSTKASSKSNSAITQEDIASESVGGITEFGHSDGSFESALGALSMLPRGQKLIAEMIRPGDAPNTYKVRFPGDTTEYRMTPQNMESCGIRDKALWSTLIRCAQSMKAQRDSNGSLEEGLSWLTGKKAEKVHAGTTTQQALTVFIRDAVKAQNPIVCFAGDPGTFAELVEPGQAYIITEFDPGTGMVTIKNPRGANSRRFRLKPDHPDHRKFEQLNDGVCKMDISLFPRYFSEVARSSF